MLGAHRPIMKTMALWCGLGWALTSPLVAQAPPADTPVQPPAAKTEADREPARSPAERPQDGVEPARRGGETGGLIRLDPKAEVWVDAKRKRVIVGGQICLRQGLLEMFACPRGTKEHESIVSVNTKA